MGKYVNYWGNLRKIVNVQNNLKFKNYQFNFKIYKYIQIFNIINELRN